MTHTSLEQSKALIKLGLDEKTADLTIVSNDSTPYIHINGLKRGNKEYPCWSAEALLDILPKYICDVDNEEYSFNIEKTEDGNTYFIGYKYVDRLDYDYLIDATGELIVVLCKVIKWLLTYKLI